MDGKMAEQTDNTQDRWIEKLIRFFKKMPGKKPDTEEVDYTGWHQSEEQYQKGQAEWMAQVRQRKQKKRSGDGERGTE